MNMIYEQSLGWNDENRCSVRKHPTPAIYFNDLLKPGCYELKKEVQLLFNMDVIT